MTGLLIFAGSKAPRATLFLALVLCTSSIAQAQTPAELNIGSLAPKGTPWMSLLEDLEKSVEARSNGAINVIIRPPGVMAEIEMVRATRQGDRLQGCAVTTAALAEGGNIPQLQIVELPFLFDTSEEADHVLDNTLWDPMSKILARRGFILGVWSENGWRSFATKGAPIRTHGDLKNFKMRSQESDVHMEMYRTLGATAIQKPMTEVLTALQANIIDGLDNTALYIQAGGLAQPLDYFTLSRHIYQPAAIVLSKRWMDSIDAELQKIVLEEGKILTQKGRDAIREEEQAMMENFEMFDVEVIELSKEEREGFAKVARTMHDSFAENISGGTELLNDIRAALKALRAK